MLRADREQKAKSLMVMQLRSTAVRQEIEKGLTSRIPAALSPQAAQTSRLLPTSNEAVNNLLGGGLPIGGICEFTGSVSTGRTSLAFSVLSEATADSACAYIDVSGSLDAVSAAAAGVQLTNLLWVRFLQEQESNQVAQRNNFTKVVTLTPDRAINRSIQHHGIRQPRSEMKGIDNELQKTLVQKAEFRLKKMEGTPGYPNQKLSLGIAPEVQIAYAHFNARRADPSDPLRQIDQRAADEAYQRAQSFSEVQDGLKKERKPWSKLDKATKVADQILKSGGFGVVVLDLASIPPEQALRIPSATWYRFSRAAQDGNAILLLLTQEPCSRSSAKCVLDCSPGTTVTKAKTTRVFGSMKHTAEVVRQRVSNPFGKKSPGRAVEWEASAPWMRAAGR